MKTSQILLAIAMVLYLAGYAAQADDETPAQSDDQVSSVTIDRAPAELEAPTYDSGTDTVPMDEQPVDRSVASDSIIHFSDDDAEKAKSIAETMWDAGMAAAGKYVGEHISQVLTVTAEGVEAAISSTAAGVGLVFDSTPTAGPEVDEPLSPDYQGPTDYSNPVTDRSPDTATDPEPDMDPTTVEQDPAPVDEEPDDSAPEQDTGPIGGDSEPSDPSN